MDIRRAYSSNISQIMYHAGPNTLFAHMSGQPSSVNLETLGNMHQCQQTSLRKIILLPSIILCPVTAYPSSVHLSGSACHWLDTVFTQLRLITTLIIAMWGGSYFPKRGVRKKGGSREHPEPPWLRAC